MRVREIESLKGIKYLFLTVNPSRLEVVNQHSVKATLLICPTNSFLDLLTFFIQELI